MNAAAELQVRPAPALEAARQPEEHGLARGTPRWPRAAPRCPAPASADTASPVSSRPCSDGPARGVGEDVDGEHRGHGARERGERQGQEHAARPARAHGQHGAQGRARAHAEQAGVGHGVAEDGLQRGADHGQPAADERGQQHARQAHRPEDGLAAGPERGGSPAASPGAPGATRRRRAAGSGTLPSAAATRTGAAGSSSASASEDARRRRARAVTGRRRGHAVGMQPARPGPSTASAA